MMTYITREKYGASMRDLPDTVLRQQLDECVDLFDQLTGIKEESNHPCVRMWRGYEYALAAYAMMGGLDWIFHRGFAEGAYNSFFYKAVKEMQNEDPNFIYEKPPWMGDPAVHLSHRSNLVRRGAPSQWKNCPKNWPYIWPVVEGDSYTLWLSKGDKKRVLEGTRARPPAMTLERIVNWP